MDAPRRFPFSCAACGQGFAEWSELLAHVRFEHPTTTKWRRQKQKLKQKHLKGVNAALVQGPSKSNGAAGGGGKPNEAPEREPGEILEHDAMDVDVEQPGGQPGGQPNGLRANGKPKKVKKLPLPCNECPPKNGRPRTFRNMRQLKNHREKERPQLFSNGQPAGEINHGRLVCNECPLLKNGHPRVFRKIEHLRNHQQNEHPELVQHFPEADANERSKWAAGKCKFCRRQFADREALAAHLIARHLYRRAHFCPQCTAYFPTALELWEHCGSEHEPPPSRSAKRVLPKPPVETDDEMPTDEDYSGSEFSFDHNAEEAGSSGQLPHVPPQLPSVPSAAPTVWAPPPVEPLAEAPKPKQKTKGWKKRERAELARLAALDAAAVRERQEEEERLNPTQGEEAHRKFDM
ncbi:hypothetical protein M3Y99_00891900 [Aphelenchoides fujianensis]|nr:hypothetical protein M3Y99_00891900 [Aphelenchoides fujianensis]